MRSIIAILLITFSLVSAEAQFTIFNPFGPANAEPIVYVPQNVQGPVPVVVMLHGCTQDGSVFARATHMNTVADNNGFAVIYAQQSRTNNPLNCFNWFDSRNHRRGGPELQAIMDTISNLGSQIQIDPRRIYVAGFSAGGAMASLLMACYSDVFAAGAIHSGLAFAAASNQFSALSVMKNPSSIDVTRSAELAAACSGKAAQPVPTFVIHGTNDTVVHPGHSQMIIDQFLMSNDMVDDGQLNGSVSANIFSSETVEGALPANLLIYNNGAYPSMAQLIVKGMDHAWSGGSPSVQYTDQRGPDVSDLIWRFFYRNYRHSEATEGFYSY